MNSFKDFGLQSSYKGFQGEKIKIERVLNKEIVVDDYKIEASKFTGKCLHLQITVDNAKRIVFTGSGALMEMIQRINRNDFPFTTTIIKENERFEFT